MDLRNGKSLFTKMIGQVNERPVFVGRFSVDTYQRGLSRQAEILAVGACGGEGEDGLGGASCIGNVELAEYVCWGHGFYPLLLMRCSS